MARSMARPPRIISTAFASGAERTGFADAACTRICSSAMSAFTSFVVHVADGAFTHTVVRIPSTVASALQTHTRILPLPCCRGNVCNRECNVTYKACKAA